MNDFVFVLRTEKKDFVMLISHVSCLVIGVSLRAIGLFVKASV